ncbi:unnamed protein product [Rotaria magnacalcarata]|uniref:Uncharacterized protein n=1 Tax=Rotaria magnacalcarata TaxID=392030 RepID=A0A816ZQ51_9BILA|nr:unnamed protein product [Rotaria magnacalcarata]
MAASNDNDNDDFFYVKSPDYQRLQHVREEAAQHCAEENKRLLSRKKDLENSKDEEVAKTNSILNESAKQIKQLEQQVDHINDLESSKTELLMQKLELDEQIE